MIRKLTLLLLGALFSSCSNGGDSNSPAAPPIKLGFIVGQPKDAWSKLEWKFADEAQQDLGFTLVKIGASDEQRVLAAIDDLAAQGAQGFVIRTPDAHLGPAIVARAQAKELKLLSVDERFLGEDGEPMQDVPFLGLSEGRIGTSVGVALRAEQRKRGWTSEETSVLALTAEEAGAAKERIDSAIAALTAADFPAERIFEATTLEAANGLLAEHGDVKKWLVCGLDDNAVLGAVRALETRGFGAESVVGIGIGGIDCISELEKKTPTGFFGSVLLSARQHGYQTCELLQRWIKDGVEPPLDTRTSGVLIQRANFRQVRKDQGLAR